MKTFAAYLGVLFCLVFIADRGLGYFFNKFYGLNKIGDTGGKINYYLSSPAPELLIMGSSRALFINPDSFKVSCFNLAHEGMDDVFQAALLDIICKANKKPKVLLLHIEPETFSFADTDKYSTGIQNLRFYYGKNKLVTEYTNAISPHERFFFLLHLYRFNGRAFNLLNNYFHTRFCFKPYEGNQAPPPGPADSITTVTLANQATHPGTFKISRMKYLLKCIDLCRENNIRLILFTSPFYGRRFHEPEALDSMLHSENITYINYEAEGIPALENKPSLWKDPVHLNNIGAQIESGCLARRARKILNECE